LKRAALPFRPGSIRFWIVACLLGLMPVVSLALPVRYYRKYSAFIDERLSDGRWQAPSRLLAQPVKLRPGMALKPERLTHWLERLGYQPRGRSDWAAGRLETTKSRVTFFLRDAPGGKAEPIVASFSGERLGSLRGLKSRRGYDSVSLEPQVLTFLLNENRDRKHLVSHSEFPAHLVHAVLAIEDRRFFSHHGLDLPRIVAAAMRNIEAEDYAQGASTITQQLVRTSFLHPEKTMRRKLQEAFLATLIERRLSKQEILELYLNEVYWGRVGSFSIYGVGQAARTYFGKDVDALAVGEAALLAGMLQSPNKYSPYRHPEAARARRDQVLRAMQEAGYLESAAVRAVAAEPIEVRPPVEDPVDAPYFVELAKGQMEERHSRPELAAGNLTVHTTLDPWLQGVAEDVLDARLAALEQQLGRRGNGPLQGAIVVLEPATGAVKALVGGRSYKQSQFNRALRAERQAGSAFKPFVYLAAFESTFLGAARQPITAASVFDDVPSSFQFEDKIYTPRNNDDRYLGRVTARKALAISLNVATVKVAESAGYGAVVDLWSRRLGMDSRVEEYPSVALGSFEVTPYQLAAAYNVLATRGLRVRPTAILTIENEAGEPLPPARTSPQRAVHEESAFLVTDMLRSVINEGTGNPVRHMGFFGDAAGKTGTTNGSRDAWFAGFTPELLCLVWVGFDDNTPLDMPAAEVALPIWVDFMKTALSGLPAAEFPGPPAGMVTRTIDPSTGLLAMGYCPARSEIFIAGTEPRQYCMAHLEPPPLEDYFWRPPPSPWR
jgi:penicillin-binding protein 1B